MTRTKLECLAVAGGGSPLSPGPAAQHRDQAASFDRIHSVLCTEDSAIFWKPCV